MPRFGENWDDRESPLAYLISIRTYGTWLHGDERGSVDNHGIYDRRGAPYRPPDAGLLRVMRENMQGKPYLLSSKTRPVVHESITNVCKHRGYGLLSLNVRSNQAHSVVSAQEKPEQIAIVFKSYATRSLRERGLATADVKIWSRGRSRKYLWDDRQVAVAIDYVLYCQGDEDLDAWNDRAGGQVFGPVD